MTAIVDICNAAASHIGEEANIVAIDPPENSLIAEKCAQFYPIARDSLLTMYDFDFATREITGAELVSPTLAWQHAYAWPNDALRVFAVLPASATNNYTNALDIPGYSASAINQYVGNNNLYATPQRYITADFEPGTDADGTRIILTNQPEAKLRYTVRVTDSTKFSTLYTETLGFWLAGYLAGPIIRGSEGRLVAKEMRAAAIALMGLATTRDANQQQRHDPHTPKWIAAHTE